VSLLQLSAGRRSSSHAKKPRRVAAPVSAADLIEFRTAREDIPLVYVSPDMKYACALVTQAGRASEFYRLDRRQLKLLLANDHSQDIRACLLLKKACRAPIATN
jgi:hypothetical protein